MSGLSFAEAHARTLGDEARGKQLAIDVAIATERVRIQLGHALRERWLCVEPSSDRE